MAVIVSTEHEDFKLTVDRRSGIAHNAGLKNRLMELHACRGSFAAFQMVLLGSSHLSVSLNEDPWFSEHPDAQVVAIRHEGPLTPSLNHIALHTGDDGREYADRLMNDPVCDVQAGVPISVFIRFEIPEDTEPGHYEGCFRIVEQHLFDDEAVLDTVRYSLTVTPVTLPENKDRHFDLDLWQHNCNIARKAGVKNWSDRHFELMEQYVASLTKLGQNTVTVIASEVPWSGQRCFMEPVKANLFEYSMIGVTEEKGTYKYDFSVMDRYIELCFRHGIDKRIEVFGLIGNWISDEHGYGNFTELPEAIRVRYKAADGTYRYMKKAEDIKDYIRKLYDHFAAKGWLDKVRVVADEPSDREALRGSIKMISAIAPAFKYKAAFIHKEFYEKFKDVISDFCLEIIGFSWEFEYWKKVFREDRDHCFTYYVCCYPLHPNTMLSNGLLEARYIPALAHYYGLSGFLRWNYTIWPNDPRKDIRYAKWPAGDTNFVYPAADGTPELSLRYMALRRGAEDFELLEMLKEKGREDLIERFYQKVISNPEIPSFYDDDKSKIPFKGLSAATAEDYIEFRKFACEALL